MKVLLLFLSVVPQLWALFVEVPCCSQFPHLGALFGPRLPFFYPGVSGLLSRSNNKECTGILPGTIVLVDRHNHNEDDTENKVSFVDLVFNCQNQGASAVVVRESNDNKKAGSRDLVRMGGAGSHIQIPSIFVSKSAGEELDKLLVEEVNRMVVVQLYQADDLGYMLMLVRTVNNNELLEPLHRNDDVDDEDVEQQEPVPAVVVVVRENKTLPIVFLPPPAAVSPRIPVEVNTPLSPPMSTAEAATITLVNGEPVFDQQDQ